MIPRYIKFELIITRFLNFGGFIYFVNVEFRNKLLKFCTNMKKKKLKTKLDNNKTSFFFFCTFFSFFFFFLIK